MVNDDLQEKDVRTWCQWIHVPEDLIREFLNAAKELRQNETLAKEFSTVRKSFRGDTPLLQKFTGIPVEQGWLLTGLAVLSLFPVMNERHLKLGVAEKITRNTQQDLLVWMEHEKAKTGYWGLAEADWLRNHLSGRIFRLGRLQFKPAIWDGIDAGEIRCGDNILEVHIPAGGKMDAEDCRWSINAAPEFFRKHLPTVRFKAFTCESWLLDPALVELLPESSNIVRFQNLWAIYPSEKNEQQACERILGQYPVDLNTAPQETHLQKQLLLRIRQGNPIRNGIGVIYGTTLPI